MQQVEIGSVNPGTSEYRQHHHQSHHQHDHRHQYQQPQQFLLQPGQLASTMSKAGGRSLLQSTVVAQAQVRMSMQQPSEASVSQELMQLRQQTLAIQREREELQRLQRQVQLQQELLRLQTMSSRVELNVASAGQNSSV